VQTAAFGAEETAAAEITDSPHVAPAERFDKRPNQPLFGLRLGWCPELSEASGKGFEPGSQRFQRCVVGLLPSGFVPDPLDKENRA
jgi:hypothetical protein